MRFARPCRSHAYDQAHLPPSPHLHDDGDDDDDGDTAHSAAQYRRHPSPTPSQTNLRLMTRRTALVYGRYNKLGTDAVISHTVLLFVSTYFSTSSSQAPHCLRQPRPTPHVGRFADLPEGVECPQGEQAPRQGLLAPTHRAAQRHFVRRAPCANPPVTSDLFVLEPWRKLIGVFGGGGGSGGKVGGGCVRRGSCGRVICGGSPMTAMHRILGGGGG
jgi:hypothetical protein